jgi:non-ribosomal peptide synthetase component F
VDFAAWQRAQYGDGELQREFDSWRARVTDSPVPKLPFIVPADAPIVAGMLERTIPAEAAIRLTQVAGETATTMPMLVLAAFMVALHRGGGQPRLSVPTSASGRDRPELDRVVGFLSTSHLVTVDLAGTQTGRECLTRVRNALLSADEEQGISLSQYTHLAGVPYEAVPYRITMNYLPDIQVPTSFGGARVELLPRQSPFVLSRDILLIARREADALRLSFGYARGVVAEDGLRQLIEHMTDALDGFAKDLDAPLSGPRPDPEGNIDASSL